MNPAWQIPDDLNAFLDTEIANDEYGGHCLYLFRFCSKNELKSIADELADWGGTTDYRSIINTLPDYQDYFVFADCDFHLFSYAIRLHTHDSSQNDVIVICGDQYQSLGKSFSEFLVLFSAESAKLYMG